MLFKRNRKLLLLPFVAAFIIAGVSCNSKSTGTDEEIAVTASMVAVKNFYINANDSVLSHLDSVFFTIDLKNGIIFNADSLPKDTKVSKLVPTITFANTVSKADLIFQTTDGKDSTVNYLNNNKDTIDFTYPVKLEVVAADGLNEMTYTIKVNVHKQKPDTLIWDKMSVSMLPSRFENPVAQKTIYRNPVAYTLVEEYNGSYTLSMCEELNEGKWEKNELEFGFIPRIETYTVTSTNFYILDIDGNLYSSEDNESWLSTGEKWENIIGGIEVSVLGIADRDGVLKHTSYPKYENLIESPVSDRFPIKGFSKLGVENNEWADSPFAVLAGGMTQEGELTGSVWAYDGNSWGEINDSSLPALYHPMMARYVVFRDTPFIFSQREFDVWLVFGGITDENEMNREVYMSYDNGVHWSLAPDLMQLPESLPSLEDANVIVAGYDLSTDLADIWQTTESAATTLWTRTSYVIEGTEITWVCPYMYVFGGYKKNGELSTNIWRGVLARLRFTPSV